MVENISTGGGGDRVRSLDNTEKRIMSDTEIESHLFWSFYYSQGDPDLQKNILTLAAAVSPELETTYALDTDTDRTALEGLSNVFFHRFNNYVQGGTHQSGIDSATVREQVRVQLGTLLAAFRKDRPTLNQSEQVRLGENIIRGMITSDEATLRGSGRERERSVISGPLRKHICHFNEYILQGLRVQGEPISFAKMKTRLRDLVDKIPEWCAADETKGNSDLEYTIRWVISIVEEHSKVPVDLSAFPALAHYLGRGSEERREVATE